MWICLHFIWPSSNSLSTRSGNYSKWLSDFPVQKYIQIDGFWPSGSGLLANYKYPKKWIVEKEKGHFSWTLRTPARYARIRGSSYEAQAASSRLARPSLGLSAAHTQSCNVFLITLALAIWIRGLFGPAMHSYKVMSIVTFGFFL